MTHPFLQNLQYLTLAFEGSGDGHNREFRPRLSQHSYQLESLHVRHDKIGNQQIEVSGFIDKVQCFLARSGLCNTISGLLQYQHDRTSESFIVIGHQNSISHEKDSPVEFKLVF